MPNQKANQHINVVRLYDCVKESNESIKTVILLLKSEDNYNLCFGILKKVEEGAKPSEEVYYQSTLFESKGIKLLNSVSLNKNSYQNSLITPKSNFQSNFRDTFNYGSKDDFLQSIPLKKDKEPSRLAVNVHRGEEVEYRPTPKRETDIFNEQPRAVTTNEILERIKKLNMSDRKSTRLNSSHRNTSRMPSSA